MTHAHITPDQNETWWKYAADAGSYHAELGVKQLQALVQKRNVLALERLLDIAINATAKGMNRRWDPPQSLRLRVKRKKVLCAGYFSSFELDAKTTSRDPIPPRAF